MTTKGMRSPFSSADASSRTRTSLALACVALCAVPLAAQKKQGNEPELWLLPKVIQHSVKQVRASVVTVETFGGFRKVIGAKPKRPGIPIPKPRPKPKKQDKKKKKSLGPIKMPGFIQAQGPSTGLIVDKDGWILTSSFALNWDPTSILVTLDDGRKFTAEVRGRDESRGIALLKVDASDLPTPTIVPKDEIQVGQWCFAVARTFGHKDPTVHAGMVSALHRIQGRAVQCDAFTSPANYGGPLVDLDGRVLGIIAPLSPQGEAAGVNWYDSGIGFAATLHDIADKIDGMKKGVVYKRGRMGITSDGSHLGPGARIASTRRDTPANHANLRKGDMLVEVNGVVVRNSMHLQDLVGYHVAGDWIKIKVRRKDKSVSELMLQLDG